MKTQKRLSLSCDWFKERETAAPLSQAVPRNPGDANSTPTVESTPKINIPVDDQTYMLTASFQMKRYSVGKTSSTAFQLYAELTCPLEET